VSVRWRLIPREEAFFEGFVKMATEIRLAATLFQEMVGPDEPLWDRAGRINDVEHRCDALTRDVLLRLHRTFVTPIDREDIHALALALDDVADAIDDCAKLMQLYRLGSVRQGVRELAKILYDQTGQVEKAMEALRDKGVVSASTAEIDRLEHDGDVVYQDAIVALFEHEKDPIQVIKWKELYAHLEAATDRCEDVGNVVDGISVKHA
jgi:predicted phosphate transport protein (TIGR00153 family)